MTKIERETIINFNDEEDEASIYSCQPRIWHRCEKLGLKAKNIRRDSQGNIISKEYYCPKKWIKINKPKQLSDEAREKLAERCRKLRSLE